MKSPTSHTRSCQEPRYTTMMSLHSMESVQLQDLRPFEDLKTIGETESATGKIKAKPPSYIKGCCGSKPAPPTKVDLFKDDDERDYDKVEVRKLAIIVNPNAGKKTAPKLAAMAKKKFEERGIEVELWETQRQGHATDMLRNPKLDLEGYDTIVGIGGDGTLSEMLQGLLTRDDKGVMKDGKIFPLSLIPGGTGNSLMADADLMDPKDAIQRIMKGVIRDVDGGTISYADDLEDGPKRHWFNTIAIGLGVDTNFTAEKLRWMGLARYNVAALWNIMKGYGKNIKVVIDDEYLWEGLCPILMITNTQSATFRFHPFARMNDGLLDGSIQQQMGRKKVLDFFDQLKADGSHAYAKELDLVRFRKMTILNNHGAPCYVNVDGENEGQLPITVESVPQMFRLII